MLNQKHWNVEQITVGDRTTRITHIPSGTVAHGRDEAEAWLAMAQKLGDRVGQLPSAGGLDFDVEAKRAAFAIAAHPLPDSMGRHTADVADLLRRVWNARGAVDIAKLETALPKVAAAPVTGDITRALRTFDR